MSFIKIGKENSSDLQLHYTDQGKGKVVVLIHGYPQSSTAWEKQMDMLLKSAHRVIAYDRRGFGKSSKPSFGYDFNTFAEDLNQLIVTLDLKDVVLIGHSMGTGEIARYLYKYGSERIEKAIFISPLQPFLLKTADNVDGLEQSVFDGFQKAVEEDRYAFLSKFFASFYSSGLLGHNGVSEEAMQNNKNVGAQASAKAIYECIASWTTDFRIDLERIKIPSLIIHGTGDKVIPFAISAKRMHSLLPNSTLAPIAGAPHGLLWTHANAVNQEILYFLSGISPEKVEGVRNVYRDEDATFFNPATV